MFFTNFQKKIIFTFIIILSFNIQAQNYQLLDKIIATAEKDVVTLRELNKEIATKIGLNKFNNLPLDDQKKVKNDITDLLIKKKLIIQYADQVQLTPSQQEIDMVVNKILKDNDITIIELEKDLISNGTNILEFKDDLKYQLSLQKIKDREIMPYVFISDYEINEWQKENGSNNDEEFRASHIFISKKNPRANEIIEDISKNLAKDNFHQFVEKYSEGPNKNNNGDLGWNKSDSLPDIFLDFLKNANIDDISKKIESDSGFHFLKLDDLKKSKNKNITIRQYKFQQILLKYNAISTDDLLQAKLINIKNLIIDGLDFSKAVMKYSEDQYNIDPKKLNWINFDDLLPEFKDELVNYPMKKIIGPFKTNLGWHLVKVYDFQEADITNETRKQQAKINIARKKTDLKFDDWVNALIKNSKIKYLKD